MGTVSVVGSSTVWSKSGNQGMGWQTSEIDLGGASSVKFEYVKHAPSWTFFGCAAIGAVTIKCRNSFLAPTTYFYLLHITYYILHTTYYILLTTYHLPLTTY